MAIEWVLFASLFGGAAGDLLKKSAERYVVKSFGNALDKIAGRARKDDLTLLTERALGFLTEMVLSQLHSQGYTGDDLEELKPSLEELLQAEAVAHEAMKPVLDSGETEAPSPFVLRRAWKATGGPALPTGFSWDAVAAAYRRQVEKDKIKTPELRERLEAETLLRLLQEVRELKGPQPQGDVLRYAVRMRQEHQRLNLTALVPKGNRDADFVPLREVFIPQDVRENPAPVELPRDLMERIARGRDDGDEDVERLVEKSREVAAKLERARELHTQAPRRPVLEVIGNPQNRRMVLIGDPGSGKSTLTRYLLLRLLDEQVEASEEEPPPWLQPLANHLPLLVELKEFIALRNEGVCTRFLDFWHHLGETQGLHLNKSWLDGRLRSEPSLVLFDGLDEIFDPRARERVSKEIAGFVHDYPKCRVVVTSRPVGYQEGPLRNAGFRHFGLQSFDDAQIETFTNRWFERVFDVGSQEKQTSVERVLSATASSPPIRLLAGNPMLLTIMALIARRQELPRERSDFYEHSAEVLCHHWDVNRHLEEEGIQAQYVTLKDKKELLQRIAYRMQSAEQGLAGNFIHQEDLAEEIETYLLQRFDDLTQQEAELWARTLIERLRDRNYILCLYGAGVYGFVHRTFLEYFCALTFTRRLKENPEYTFEDLKQDVLARRWNDPSWAEVLRLLCGLSGDDYGSLVIRYLVDEANPQWQDRWPREVPNHLTLATQCLAELQNLKRQSDVASHLLKTLIRGLESVPVEEAYIYFGIIEWQQALLPAVREVGTQWPNREWFAERLRQGLTGLEKAPLGIYANLGAILFSDRREIQDLYKELASSGRLRRSGTYLVRAIAQGWGEDPETLTWLKKHAFQDDHEAVRSTAVEAIAQGWGEDPETLTWLKKHAFQDDHYAVRRAAVQAIAQGWSEEPETLPWLKDQAFQDDHYAVRRAALEALARSHLPSRARTLLSRDLDGISPFLDPREPLADDHIHQAAERFQWSDEDIHQILDNLTETLGWDPRVGAAPVGKGGRAT